MTAIAAVRSQLITAIAAQIPTVQVSGFPPAETTALKEAIWLERAESEFEWRSLGATATFNQRNRLERVTIDLRVHVYREAEDQTVAADDALDRAEVLFAKIEDALEADFSLANTVAYALVTRWSVELRPRDSGWSADGRATVQATNYP